MNHFFFAFNLRGLSGVYYYWGKVGRMMEMTANHIMYWSDCHWHFVKMSQMQIFYTKSCNLCQARTRLSSRYKDVSTGAIGVTAVAPKFSDTLTVSPPGGTDSVYHRRGCN